MNACVFKKVENRIKVQGCVCFKNAKKIYEEGAKLIPEQNSTQRLIRFDCSKFENADSSGLALLTAWVRKAKKHHKEIIFDNVSSELLNLSRVYGLESILPFAHLVEK